MTNDQVLLAILATMGLAVWICGLWIAFGY
jgi:hypothetical protein